MLVNKVRFDLEPGGCTRCGRVHDAASPDNRSPLYCPVSEHTPGGDSQSTCTHFGGCKPFCLGVYYQALPDGKFIPAAIQRNHQVVGEERRRKPPDYRPLIAGSTYTRPTPAGICRCAILSLMSVGHDDGCPEKRR